MILSSRKSWLSLILKNDIRLSRIIAGTLEQCEPGEGHIQRGVLKAGLPYYRPHSFRKMLVIWAMENCSQIQVKAISQNIGHEHAMTTYNAYGTLNIQTQRNAILGIGEGHADLQNVSMEELLKEVSRRACK